MKEHWSLSNDKLISTEEGLESEIRKNVKEEKIYLCELFIQIIKLILYFQLICFVAWGGYTFWQVYNQHENIHSYISYSNYSSSSEDESLKVLNESSSLPLNNVEETLETMTTTNIPFEKDVLGNKILPNDDQFVTTTKILDSSSDKDDISIINSEDKSGINPFENTSTYKPIKDSSELQIDDYKNSVKDRVSSSEIIENKDKENSVDQAVFEWYFPLFSTIYMEPKLSIDDSLEESRNSEPDAGVKDSLKEVEDHNEESDFNSDEYDSAFEEMVLEKNFLPILKLFDELWKDLPDNYSSSISDDFVETTESSRMDEGSEDWNPNVVFLVSLGNWKQDSTEASAFISEEDSEEKTKSSLFHDRLIEKEEEEEEDPYDYLKGNHGHGYFDLATPSFVKSVDSEKSDISKLEDDATSDLKSQFWKRSSFLPTMLFPTLDWRLQDSSIETSKTEEESTEMSTTFKQHIDDFFNTPRLWKFPDRDNVDHSVFPSTENADSEKEIEDGQSQNNDTCIEDIMNGFKVLKCHSNPFQSSNEEQDLDTFKDSDDRSLFTPFIDKEGKDESAQNTHFFIDPSDPLNSYEIKSPAEYVDTNYGIIDQKPIQESMDFTNSESGKPDILTERWTKMKPSTDAYLQEENSYQDTEDPIRWWLDLSRYHEKQPMFGDEILEKERKIPKITGQKTFSGDEDSYGKRKRRMTMNDETLIHDWIQMFKTRMIKNEMRKYSMARLDEKLTRFYSDMDIISSHIDVLHELYLRERKLEDDYVSKEFVNETLEIVD